MMISPKNVLEKKMWKIIKAVTDAGKSERKNVQEA